MKIKNYWVVVAGREGATTRKVVKAKNEHKAVDSFYTQDNRWYQTNNFIVESVKPLEVNNEKD